MLVEDSDSDAYTVRRVLRNHMKHPCFVRWARSAEEAEEFLQNQPDMVDVVLLDLMLPDTKDEMESFQRMEKVARSRPIVILTSLNDHDLAVDLVANGAEDYVRKSQVTTDPKILCDAIEFAICRHKNIQILQDNNRYKDQIIQWVTGSYSVMK